MQLQEKNYDFRFRMRQIHQPGRDASLRPEAQEVVVDERWRLLATGDDPLLLRATADLQDYLAVGMAVAVRRGGEATEGEPVIVFEVDAAAAHGYTLSVSPDQIRVTASTAREVWFGSLFLEELMNLRQAPYLTCGVTHREPLIRMRSVHSGSGIDDYPDWQLNAIAHAGFTAIDLFVEGIDRNHIGICDIGGIIHRAREYGLDTMLYNYVPSYIHPSDPGAEALFDRVYGELFRRYPDAAGIVLCGESLEFPSHDPATTGKRARESVVDGIPDPRPAPGWWPCCDYPDYINAIERAIRKVKPDAEVVLNTYNWGYTDVELRRKFLTQISRTVVIQTTYEIFKSQRRGNLACPVMDYTISAAEPGEYFSSELAIAKELGFRTRCTTNTAGASWDFGAVPYVPVPYRWLTRMEYLEKARVDWGLDSWYEAHHYGWWPNVMNDLAKFSATSPRTDTAGFEALLRRVAARDYGACSADAVLSAWRNWSDAMAYFTATNEDQYGPWRVGAAYPFIFHPNITRTMSCKEIQFPTTPGAHFGYKIIKTFYQPYENIYQSPGAMRYPVEIAELQKMLALWDRGLTAVTRAQPHMPENRQANGERLAALGLYIRNSIVTTIHIKQWYLLNIRLMGTADATLANVLLDELDALAEKERANVEATIPAVETDSRLGWEPSMEYVCDRWHLEWKLRQLEHARREISDYRRMLTL